MSRERKNKETNRTKLRFLLLFFIGFFFLLSIILIFFNNSNDLLLMALFALIFLILSFFTLPIISVYLIALFLPVVGLPFYYQGLELPLIDFLALIALLAFFLRYFYVYFFSPRIYQEKIKFPYAPYFLLFFLVVIVSALLTTKISFSLWYFLRWILFFYLAFLVLPFNVIKNKEQLKKTILILVIAGLILALIGLSSLFLQDFSDAFFRAQPLKIFNQWIFGDNYNLMAEFLIISSFFCLSLKYFFKNKRSQRLINVLFVFMLAIVFLSFGRTAWITVILQLFLYFSIEALWIKNKKISLANFFLYLFLISILLTPLFLKMMDLQQANISSTQNRLILTKISLKAFQDKPIWGQGSGNFVSLVDKNTRFVAKYGDPLDSHGFIQKILAENGLLGLLSFLLILFIIFREAFFFIIKEVNNQREYQLLLAIFIGAGGGIFYQLFNTSYYKGRVWFPIALLIVALNLFSEEKNLKNKKNKRNER